MAEDVWHVRKVRHIDEHPTVLHCPLTFAERERSVQPAAVGLLKRRNSRANLLRVAPITGWPFIAISATAVFRPNSAVLKVEAHPRRRTPPLLRHQVESGHRPE